MCMLITSALTLTAHCALSKLLLSLALPFFRLCSVGTATLYDFCRTQTEPKIKIHIFSQLQPQYRGSNGNKFDFLCHRMLRDTDKLYLPSKRMTSCWFKNKLRWPLTATVDTSSNNPKQKHELFIFDILFADYLKLNNFKADVRTNTKWNLSPRTQDSRLTNAQFGFHLNSLVSLFVFLSLEQIQFHSPLQSHKSVELSSAQFYFIFSF